MIKIIVAAWLLYCSAHNLCLADGHTHSNLSKRNIDPKIPSIAELNHDPDMPELLMDGKVLYTKGQSDAISRRMEAHRAYARSEACNRYDDGVFKDEYGHWRTLDGDFSPERPPQKTIIIQPRDNNRPIIFDPPSPEPPQTEFIENPAPLPEVHEPSSVPSIPDLASPYLTNPSHDSWESQRYLALPQGPSNYGFRVQRSQPTRHPRFFSDSKYSDRDRKIFSNMTDNDFRANYEANRLNLQEVLNDYELYAFSGFRYFVQTLPGYEQFILNLHHKIDTDKQFRNNTFSIKGFKNSGYLFWQKSAFHDFVNQEAEKIVKAQATRHRQAEEQARKIEAARQQQEAEHKKWAQEEHVRRQKCMDVSDTQSLETLINEWTKEIKDSEERNNQDNTNNSKQTEKNKPKENPDISTNNDTEDSQALYAQRIHDRLEAIEQLLTDKNPYSNYAENVPKIILNDYDLSAFDNTYGTALDRQLHKELVTTCNDLSFLIEDYDDIRLKVLAPEIYRLAAQAKREQHMKKAFELSDNCFTFTRVAIFALYKAPVAVCKGTGKMILNRCNPYYWWNIATSSFELAQEISAWQRDLFEHRSRLTDALLANDRKLYDQLIRERQARDQLESDALYATLDIAYQKMKKMSWAELIEHGTEIGTGFIFDRMLFAKIGTAASTLADSADPFMQQLSGALKQGLLTEEYAANVAGFGRVIIQEGAEAAPQALEIFRKTIDALGKGQSPAKLAAIKAAQEQIQRAKFNKEALEYFSNIPSNILDEMEGKLSHTIRDHIAISDAELIKRIKDDPFIAGASSFSNKRVAINAISQNLRKNAPQIITWLEDKTSNAAKHLTIEYKHSYPIGKGIPRNKNKPIYGLKNSKIILTRDAKCKFECRLYTAFPDISK